MNLALLHEAIALRLPDHECLVFRDRRLTWSDVTDRTRRLAAVLKAHGLGCHSERRGAGERQELAGWESGQDHVGLYLWNGNEYMEGMLGAFKARCAPFNVNYRYVEDELVYLFGNADARAVVYHARFAPTLSHVRDRLPGVALWLQVADDSGEPLLPGALDYEQALREAQPDPPQGLSPDDLYILYTGGTTGMPKGVLWRQQDIFRAALNPGPPDVTLGQAAERAVRRPGIRSLPIPPFMHGAAHWVVFNMWHVGGTIVVQSHPGHLDPDDVWSTVERERVNTVTIVGDAFARPLIDQLDRKQYDLSSLTRVTSGGAIFTASLKRELLAHVPHVRILDALGSSESGAQAGHVSSGDDGASTGDFELAPDSTVLREDLSGPVPEGSDEVGWLARRGSVPLGYYKDADKSARTFPVVGGERYSVPGDRAKRRADGGVQLLGRDSVTINSGGEKIFAEEVELVLKSHPAVYDAVVVGVPSERWGQQVTALVRLRPGAAADAAALKSHAAEHLARYKLPKDFLYVDDITRAPSGKADYRWAKRTALEALGLDNEGEIR